MEHTLKDRGISLAKLAAAAFIAVIAADTVFISDLFGSIGLVAIPSLVAVVTEGLAWLVAVIKGDNA